VIESRDMWLKATNAFDVHVSFNFVIDELISDGNHSQPKTVDIMKHSNKLHFILPQMLHTILE